VTFTTKPAGPTNFTATAASDTQIDLSWIIGDGAGKTMIRRSMAPDPAPAAPDEGEQVYFDTGTSCSDIGLVSAKTYCYRAWSRAEDYFGEDVWSETYADDEAMTAVEPETVDFGITLQSGWNMVSVPLVMQDMLTSQVFPGAVAVYTWNPSTKSYEAPAYIEPEKAYWVAVTVETPRPWHGVPVSAWDSPIAAGWNMMGSVYSTEPAAVESLGDEPPESILRNAIYRWDPLSKSYEPATAIERGIGYWLAATQDCELVMTAP